MHEEILILVDENDQITGFEEKNKAHELGLLHRAFSVFIFNDKKQLMLQQRAEGKYHSGSLWSNTCCGHPRILVFKTYI
jgi:isopentenyl-diphosphate delta-isomerase